LNGGSTSVDGPRRESFQSSDDHCNENDGDDDPHPLSENFQIIPKMNLLFLLRRDRIISWRGELEICF